MLHLQTLKKTKYFETNLKNWKKHVNPLIRNQYLKDPFIYIKDHKNRDLVYESHFNLLKYSKFNAKTKFHEINYCQELLRNRMLNELFNEVVPVILKHDDLNSMYYSIENRSPYLDKDLLNFSLSIPAHLLIKDGYQKKVLRDSAKNILVENIRNDRQKKGFNASIDSLVDLNNPKTFNHIFDEKSSIAEIIDLKKVKEDIKKNFIPNHMSKLLFSIISTKIFIDNK